MVESVLSVVLVGGVVVAALNTVGASSTARNKSGVRARGNLLAASLMTEILTQAYEEPQDAIAFGLETGELGTTRASFDDVDDYRNAADSPPRLKDGTPLSGFDDWSRSATVVRADPASPNVSSTTETGVKRITVMVKYKGAVVASATALKSSASPPAGATRSLLNVTVPLEGTLDQSLE